jgi:phosphoglycolate phosphatase
MSPRSLSLISRKIAVGLRIVGANHGFSDLGSRGQPWDCRRPYKKLGSSGQKCDAARCGTLGLRPYLRARLRRVVSNAAELRIKASCGRSARETRSPQGFAVSPIVNNIVTKNRSVITIVFDLDGTLVDTAPDLVDALNFTLRHDGLQVIPYADARALIGRGMRSMIERALIFETRNSARADVDVLYRRFVSHYAEHIAERSLPFPGVATGLDRLAASGYRLAVCTNKLESLSRRLLDKLGLSERFAAICGQDTFGLQKPDPQMFRETVRRAGGQPTRAIMVGDSITDIHTARAANVPIVAVDFGYADVPVATLNPDRIVSTFAELPTAIADLGLNGAAN